MYLLTLKTDHEKLIAENCKTIYFASHEASMNNAAWCLKLIATYHDWQDQAEVKVPEVCGQRIPSSDDLRNLKVVHWYVSHPSLALPDGTSGWTNTIFDGK